ncbi:hypothetical protein FXN61_24005 [Lentzea sp. PSKA42]|uniref:Uncharacterized protein n=1 Tax=Lentzea indica TaxID=2604800 RepID=A0ABX1FM95_9PSEU|nr:hypothetical protein [Lentzea indica]NKE59707.1 hypothetical protein [Lentzea indica]
MINLQQVATPLSEDVRRLEFALAGFRAARSRHEEARAARDLGSSYTSAVEATMWVIAINDQLEKLYGQSYKGARDQDTYGLVTRGVRWVRNRHAHQLPVTVDEDPTTFFGGTKGIISLNAGIRWREVSELPPPDPRFPDPDGETAYRAHMEGRGTHKALAMCDLWFSELEKCPSFLLRSTT